MSTNGTIYMKLKSKKRPKWDHNVNLKRKKYKRNEVETTDNTEEAFSFSAVSELRLFLYLPSVAFCLWLVGFQL